MIEQKEEFDNSEIIKKGFEKFFQIKKEFFASTSHRTEGIVDGILNKFNNNKQELVNETIEAFSKCELNTNQFSIEEINKYRDIVENEVEKLINEIKEETKENFIFNFNNLMYYNLPATKSSEYNIGDIKHELCISDSNESLLKRDRVFFEESFLSDFQKSKKIPQSCNKYQLSLENLDFLRTVLKEMVDQLLVDIKERDSKKD